jgi:hypothetical protein
MTEIRDVVPHLSTSQDAPDDRRRKIQRLVSSEWLTSLLSESTPGVEVQDVELAEIISGASTKAFLTVHYAPGGNPNNALPESLVLKGGFEKHTPNVAFQHVNEMRFYRDIVPQVTVRVPKAYYAGVEPKEGHPIVIIENLNLQKVRFNTVFTPLSYPQVVAGLDTLARYHSCTWNSPEFESGGSLDWVVDTVKGPFGEIHDRYSSPAAWDSMAHTSQFMAVSMIFQDSSKVLDGLQALHEWQLSLETFCVVHGDAHVGNTYLSQDGTIGFLDFQVKKVPWSHDACEFIVGTLDIPARRMYEADLLREYLRLLRKYGVDAPDFDQAWAAHRRNIFYALFKWLINIDEWQIDAINTANTARYAAACLDHDTLNLLLG